MYVTLVAAIVPVPSVITRLISITSVLVAPLHVTDADLDPFWYGKYDFDHRTVPDAFVFLMYTVPSEPGFIVTLKLTVYVLSTDGADASVVWYSDPDVTAVNELDWAVSVPPVTILRLAVKPELLKDIAVNC